MLDVDFILKLANDFEMGAYDLGEAKDLTNAERQRRYYERQKANPSEAYTTRMRGKGEALKEMKHSGALDGLLKVLGTQLATKKNEIRKKLIRDGVDPAIIPQHLLIKKFGEDATEIYAVRDSLAAFSKTLRFVGTEEPLVADKELISKYLLITEVAKKKFSATYAHIGHTLHQIIEKLQALTSE